jgi:hypothetical protein
MIEEAVGKNLIRGVFYSDLVGEGDSFGGEVVGSVKAINGAARVGEGAAPCVGGGFGLAVVGEPFGA